MPLVANRSFAPQGMPCRGPLYFPARISRSACAACASARSSVTVTTQFSLGPYFFNRARYILVSSVEDTSRRCINGASDVIGRNARSSIDDGRAAGGVNVILIFAPGVAGPGGFFPGRYGWDGDAGSGSP